MIIDIYCAGDCSQEGRTDQKGGCGVLLIRTDKFNRIQHREFHYCLGNSGLDLAEIQAIRLSLASIAPAYRSDKVTINTNSIIAATILTSGNIEAPHLNRVAKEMIKWYSFYKDIEVVVTVGRNRYLDRSLDLARRGLESQSLFDSLTIIGDAHVTPIRPA